MLIRHKLADFDKWYPVYKEHATMRKNAGSQSSRLFRNADNPNEALLLFEWDTIENAKTFAHSDELRETMKDAGVLEKPDVFFLDEVEQSL